MMEGQNSALTGMLMVLAVVLKVHLNASPVSGLASMLQETSTVLSLATSYTNCWPGAQAGETDQGKIVRMLDERYFCNIFTFNV